MISKSPIADERFLQEGAVTERFLNTPNEDSFADLFKAFTRNSSPSSGREAMRLRFVEAWEYREIATAHVVARGGQVESVSRKEKAGPHLKARVYNLTE